METNGLRFWKKTDSGKDQIYPAMPILEGATDDIAGKAGVVPAPTVDDKNKYLKGDGTWANAKGGVGRTELAPEDVGFSEEIAVMELPENALVIAKENAEEETTEYTLLRVSNLNDSEKQAIAEQLAFPKNDEGIGQWISVDTTDTSYTLPDGGIWVTNLTSYNGGSAFKHFSSIVAGGTTVITDSTATVIQGWAWRIA